MQNLWQKGHVRLPAPKTCQRRALSAALGVAYHEVHGSPFAWPRHTCHTHLFNPAAPDSLLPAERQKTSTLYMELPLRVTRPEPRRFKPACSLGMKAAMCKSVNANREEGSVFRQAAISLGEPGQCFRNLQPCAAVHYRLVCAWSCS